jgi:predicted amidohydrolase
MSTVRTAVAQLDIQLFDVSANTRTANQAVMDAADAHCQLVVLPELANVGYITTWGAEFARDYYRCAETIPGAYSQSLIEMAGRTKMHVVVGIAERAPKLDGVLYNTALLITPAGTVHRYRKIHLPREEKRYFGEGAELEPFSTDLARLGLLICADNSFPESARLLSLRGAQLIAIPYAAERKANSVLYPQMTAIRAYENQVFVACANHCGRQDAVVFAGTSAIAGPDGTLLAELGSEPGMAWADLDLELIVSERLRQTRYRDRRPALYQDIAKP